MKPEQILVSLVADGFIRLNAHPTHFTIHVDEMTLAPYKQRRRYIIENYNGHLIEMVMNPVCDGWIVCVDGSSISWKAKGGLREIPDCKES